MTESQPDQPFYGNYHGYYSKRPFSSDPRLALLPPGIFTEKRVLDVGCNEGYVTCEIAQTLGAKKVIGVDKDRTLVRAAWRRRRAVWSTSAQGPNPDHFPMSCQHVYGPLPVPSPRAHAGFPNNVTFRTEDWIAGGGEVGEGYDVVVALFSISKWIHLTGGDAALKTFFARVHTVLRPGGIFVFEPQSWEGYAKARRMDEALRETAKHLKLRPDDFPSVLGELGFSAPRRFGVSSTAASVAPGFRRPIDVYTKL